MKKLLLLLMLLFPAFVRAQTDTTANESPIEENTALIKRYKYDVSTNLLYLINKSDGASLFLRNNLVKAKKKGYGTRKVAYRFRIGASSQLSNTIKYDTVNRYYYNYPYSSGLPTSIAIFGSAGYEWQHQYQRFQIFYGYDVTAGFNHYQIRDNSVYNNSNGTYVFADRQQKSFSLGVSPLFGIKYFIHSRISISGEAHIGLNYNRYREKFQISGLSAERRHFNSFNIGTSPLAFLNLSYHFNKP